MSLIDNKELTQENPNHGQITVNPVQIVHTARCLNWSVDMLMQSFNEMPNNVAKGLLEYQLEITQEGYIYPKE